MYCEKYSCTMTEKTCIARQKLSRRGRSFVHSNKAYDPFCKDCLQGKAIAERLGIMGESVEPKKTEKTKVCQACGEEKPLEQFVKNLHCSHGRAGTCKACKTKYERKRIQIRKKPHEIYKKKGVYVSFIDYQDLYGFVSIAAEENIRTLEQQILFILKQKFEEKNGEEPKANVSAV